MEENKQHKISQLRAVRRSLNLSQKQVAIRIGHSDQTLLAHYERGSAIPPLLTAMKLSLLYQVSLPILFPELYERVKVEILAVPSRPRETRSRRAVAIQEVS